MSFVEGHCPFKPVGEIESRLLLRDFSEDMFLIKDGMNTHKKQKYKQGIPQGHSGCD